MVITLRHMTARPVSLRTGLLARLRHRSADTRTKIGCGFLLVALFGVPASSSAQGRVSPTPSDVPPQVQIAEATVRFSVTDANDIRFSHLSRSQGLSQSQVSRIVQDGQGFMWFGTQYGLNRYDGYRFKVFKHEPDDPRSLSGVSVYALFLDHLGTMWVASGAILDKFNARTEAFAHYIIDAEPSPDVANTIRNISEDSRGALWLSTARGLYRFDPTT